MLHDPPITTAHRLLAHLPWQHHTRCRTTQLAAMRVLGHPLTDVSTRRQYPEQCSVLRVPSAAELSGTSAIAIPDFHMGATSSAPSSSDIPQSAVTLAFL
jgi:hypothetical protein